MKYPCEVVARSQTLALQPTKTPVRGGWVLATAILGSSMAFIDGTVVNVALPNMQHALNAMVVELTPDQANSTPRWRMRSG